MIDLNVLDNPVWGALTTAQQSMARSFGWARRFPNDVSPLAALQNPTRAAFSDLCTLVSPQESVGLFMREPIEVPGEWEITRSRPIDQMVFTESAPSTESASGIDPPLEILNRANAPEMLALAGVTEPGPFLVNTIQMGRYFGIRSSDGQLIAMAGERLRLEGFTEISAVCTAPHFRGRGHARTLVAFLVARILREGKIPFLHVKAENGAKALYEKLGFRRTLPHSIDGDRSPVVIPRLRPTNSRESPRFLRDLI